MLYFLILSLFPLGSINSIIHSLETPLTTENRQFDLANINASESECSERILLSFWEEYIHSFKINHGTSSIYISHFKEHGVNSTYPSILQTLIPKIRKLWDNHEGDIAEKTYAFRNFEQRFEYSQREQSIAVFFSAQPIITREHTVGYSQGGEWVRELKHFLDKATSKTHTLTPDEQKVVSEAQSFVDLINNAPPLIVSLRATTPSFRTLLGKESLLFPFPLFSDYVKRHCHGWEEPLLLSNYLNYTLLPLIEIEKRKIISLYEMKLSHPIPPEELEFEVDENTPL